MRHAKLVAFLIVLILACVAGQNAYAFLGKKKTPNAHPWPPVVGQAYPDLELIDQEGNPFRLSALKGKVILIEPIGMPCKACQAFSGGHKAGPFAGVSAQPGLPSFDQLMYQYGRVKLPRRDVVLVQLLLYDMGLKNPKPKDAGKWAKHFDLRMGHNEIVTVPAHDLRSQKTYAMIPGFQLIDKDFILRADATGHRPQHDLYRQLIPMVPKLLTK